MEDFVTESEKELSYLDDTEKGKKEDESSDDENDKSSAASGSGSGSGLIHMFTDLVSPSSEASSPPKSSMHPFDRNPPPPVVNNGGILNNLISNIFHENQQEEKEKDHKLTAPALIHNIASHLPAAPDDVDPQPDEASILIHSIIHD